jgi:hypothetical protein
MVDAPTLVVALQRIHDSLELLQAAAAAAAAAAANLQRLTHGHVQGKNHWS